MCFVRARLQPCRKSILHQRLQPLKQVFRNSQKVLSSRAQRFATPKQNHREGGRDLLQTPLPLPSLLPLPLPSSFSLSSRQRRALCADEGSLFDPHFLLPPQNAAPPFRGSELQLRHKKRPREAPPLARPSRASLASTSSTAPTRKPPRLCLSSTHTQKKTPDRKKHLPARRKFPNRPIATY